MGSAIVPAENKTSDLHKCDSSPTLSLDPRWQLVERIIQAESFQKSTRLPALLLYLARHTINQDRRKLTEHAIGESVFGKLHHYSPAEDSSVRVCVRQLRLRLHEFYNSPDVHEELIVSIPKGGYTLEFRPRSVPQSVHPSYSLEHASARDFWVRSHARIWPAGALIFFFALAVLCGFGWYRAAVVHQPRVPWPMSSIFHNGSSTTLVIADAGFGALRGLGDQEVPLDSYIDHSYLQPILPKHMSDKEAGTFHYLDSSRITSVADARAAASFASLAGPYSENLQVLSARDVNANDLTHGDFIFVGSRTSNPWVEVLESRMNFQIFEDGPHGSRYILNRDPQKNERQIYAGGSLATLASTDDYAVIALLPAKSGGGNSLVVEGARMEGTQAAIALLRSPAGRAKLQNQLAALDRGRTPQYFEALLHAQSVAGATMSVDVIAARVLQQP